MIAHSFPAVSTQKKPERIRSGLGEAGDVLPRGMERTSPLSDGDRRGENLRPSQKRSQFRRRLRCYFAFVRNHSDAIVAITAEPIQKTLSSRSNFELWCGQV